MKALLVLCMLTLGACAAPAILGGPIRPGPGECDFGFERQTNGVCEARPAPVSTTWAR